MKKKKSGLVAGKVRLAGGELFNDAFPTVADRWLSSASGSEGTASNGVLHGRWDGKYGDGTGGA